MTHLMNAVVNSGACTYNKMHLNDAVALILFLVFFLFFSFFCILFFFTIIYCVVWYCYFWKNIFSYISTSDLSYVQKFFSKMKLVKTSLCTQLKQTNLENWLHISIESPKEGFNDTVFQHFVDELRH